MLFIIAHPSIIVASGIFLINTSTFNTFFKSAFDVGYLPSLLCSNKTVGIGTISYENKSFILILYVEFMYSTLEKVISVLYLHNFFSLPLLVFSLSQLPFLFLTRNLQVNYSETNSFDFYQSLLLYLHSQYSLLSDQCIYCRAC